jgi:hypothetical protein
MNNQSDLSSGLQSIANGKLKLSNTHIRAWIDQCLFSERLFTGERELSTLDKAVALAIARYVNCKAGATYVDGLTIAKALGVKHHAVKASMRNLGKAGRLTILYKENRITPILIPRLKPNENGLHSTRGDKAFYNVRAKLTWRIMGDRRMTIAHRIAAIGALYQVDSETGETDASQKWLSEIVDVSRQTMRSATAKLEALGYITRLPNGVDGSQTVMFAELGGGKQGGKQGGKSMSEKRRQIRTSEHNIDNVEDLVNIQKGKDSDSIIEGHTLPLKFPDTAAVSLWRRNVYAFLMADGPVGMILPAEVAKLVESGLLAANGEITALGHAIGADTSSLKQEAA